MTKKLIVLGAIIFSFALTNNAHAMTYAFSNSPVTRFYSNSAAEYAGQGYTQTSYYQQSSIGYNQVPMAPINNPYVQYSFYQQSGYNGQDVSSNTAKPTTVVNNYYQGAPATTAKTNTTSTTNTTSDTSNLSGTSNGANNGLGASAYGNGITALSFRGSGSFMPSSIWQWFLVIVLILVIIIIARIILTKKPTLEMQEAHSAHAH